MVGLVETQNVSSNQIIQDPAGSQGKLALSPDRVTERVSVSVSAQLRFQLSLSSKRRRGEVSRLKRWLWRPIVPPNLIWSFVALGESPLATDTDNSRSPSVALRGSPHWPLALTTLSTFRFPVRICVDSTPICRSRRRDPGKGFRPRRQIAEGGSDWSCQARY